MCSDVEVFLSPRAHTLDGFILGESPFSTSVPSRRVGFGHESVLEQTMTSSRKDPSPLKLNLGVGAYQTEQYGLGQINGLNQTMYAQKISVSEQMIDGVHGKSDSFIVDLEGFSHGGGLDYDNSPDSMITVTLCFFFLSSMCLGRNSLSGCNFNVCCTL